MTARRATKIKPSTDVENLDLVVIGGAVIAGFVHGLSGFAFGLVAMAFWVWWLDPHIAGLLVIFGGLVGQLCRWAPFAPRLKFNAAAPSSPVEPSVCPSASHFSVISNPRFSNYSSAWCAISR